MDTLVFTNTDLPFRFVSKIHNGVITHVNEYDRKEEIPVSDTLIKQKEFQDNELGYGLNNWGAHFGYDQLFFGDRVDPGVKESATDFYFLLANKGSKCGNPVCLLLKVRKHYLSLCFQRYLQLVKMIPGELSQREVYAKFIQCGVPQMRDDINSFEEIETSVKTERLATHLDVNKLITRIEKIELKQVKV